MTSTENSNDYQKQELIFEYPLKEQIRSFLRLEVLFKLLDRNLLSTHEDNHFHALKLLFEVLEILERGDTRAELIKELSRLSSLFEKMRRSPEVDSNKLEVFLKQIEKLYQWILAYDGKFGDKIRKDPFVDSVRHRTSIPGGWCQFDCPELYLFNMQDTTIRQLRFERWLEDIKGVKTSIEVILKIMRDSGNWQRQTAPLGSYLLDTSEHSFQLLRIKLCTDSTIFPEFSCGKHRSNIHFMKFNEVHKKIAIQRKVEFEMACCV
ncbi:MAG: cell division protein ZapD [Kangiellaceae bacterium]|nr:cell division protein ZapD [Kangiellaceae bacterium]MCW9017524.1 cell division protein ZapD [Kangiellaceae bacterium]